VDHVQEYITVFEDLLTVEHEASVIDQHTLPGPDIAGKVWITDVQTILCTHTRLLNQADHITFFKVKGATFQLSDSQFGSLQVTQDTHVKVVFLVDIGDMPDYLSMLIVGPMREVESEYIDTIACQFEELSILTARWPDCR
jgi:hypothetical protein